MLLATVLEEAHSSKAEALLQHWREQDIQIAAPILLRYEIVAVMRKSVYRGILEAKGATEGRDSLLQYPVQTLIDDALLVRAYELATQFNRPTAYDAQYLAVAEHLGCEFWTDDERMFNALKQDVSWIRWLGNYVISA